MALKDEIVRARISGEVKQKADVILNDLGINTSTAIRMFLVAVVENNGLPFKIKKESKNEKR